MGAIGSRVFPCILKTLRVGFHLVQAHTTWQLTVTALRETAHPVARSSREQQPVSRLGLFPSIISWGGDTLPEPSAAARSSLAPPLGHKEKEKDKTDPMSALLAILNNQQMQIDRSNEQISKSNALIENLSMVLGKMCSASE